MAAEEQGCGDEEGGGCAGEENDGVAVGGLHGGGRGARAVEALRAALRQHGEREIDTHWAYSSNRKRNIQSAPMACQNHAVASTNTCRVAI